MGTPRGPAESPPGTPRADGAAPTAEGGARGVRGATAHPRTLEEVRSMIRENCARGLVPTPDLVETLMKMGIDPEEIRRAQIQARHGVHGGIDDAGDGQV